MAPLEILLSRKNLVAIDKPIGLSVHNDGDNVMEVLQWQLSVPKLYPVHRLDKETSGIQIFALDQLAARELAEAFQSRNVKKTYVGVLRGSIAVASGIWNSPISDKAEGMRSPAGASRERVASETQFKVLAKSAYFSLCEFDLITGRQHQIRKHAAIARHALVGDPRYGDRKYNQKIFEAYDVQRMFLHCSHIEIAGQNIDSSVPPEFSKLLGS
jgi:tRNA pseudouridine65 synthase